MNMHHLVQMANQIAQFFESQSGPDAAAVEAASHIRKFWEPRMRREIIERIGRAGDDSGLRPVALAAIRRLAQDQAEVAATPAA